MKTDPQDLLRLADEVMAATGPSLLLDRDIALAIYPQALPLHGTDARVSVWDGNGRTQLTVRPFTASLDAAEALVPEGDDVTSERYRLEAYSTNGILMPIHVRASAWVPGAPRAFAATPAMALCAAALKARAHSTKESDNG